MNHISWLRRSWRNSSLSVAVPSRCRSRRTLRHESLDPRHLLAGDLIISEFTALNTAAVQDEDGDYPDWIELYNRGDEDVALDGWYLSDDPAEPDKFALPAESLPPGAFRLVFASGKDRAVSGEPLHANFKLASDGEPLLLSRDSADGLQTVIQFDVPFPQGFSDVSYGLGQQVAVTPIVDSSANARMLIPPDGSVDATWSEPTFDDSSWTGTTASVGYQRSVPGFTVRDVHSTGTISNIAGSISLLSGNGIRSETTKIVPIVNFHDAGGGGGTGNFGDPQPFPNDQAGNDDDFVLEATATVIIPSTGTWTFGTNSDDGVRLRIDGRTVIDDDRLHAPDNSFGEVSLTAGPHELELIFFERGGGAEVELFAAQGQHSVFNVNAFQLVGDTENGGLAVETSLGASPAAGGFATLFRTDVGEQMYGKGAGSYLRIPFLPVNVNDLEALTLRVNYDDGYVAYLNGTEVARRNAPASTRWDSLASTDRPDGDALRIEDVDISQYLGLLQPNQINVLAIHGLNDAVDSDEFLLSASLAEVLVDQSAERYFTTPTPGALNVSEGVAGFLIDEIQLSHPHGFYDEPFLLTIDTLTDGTTVRYTTDGTEPTASNGQRYAGPISIGRTTTLRARAFKDDLQPSNVTTATYLFVEDVVRQSSNGSPPAGWPRSTSINGQTLDYGMDPTIVNSGTWGPQLEAALKQIPSMSISMDIDDLLGSSRGIYTHAGNHGQAWERPVALELIDPSGGEGFQVNAGLRIRGGFSRSGGNPKHAFRLFFRDEYGDGKLRFPLFGEEGVDEFDKIDLRTAQNYSWSFQGSDRNAFIRDVFSRDLQGMLGHPYTRSRYYHLYINGQYWGLYQTQERSEAAYAASYFGGNREDYDVVKSAGSSGGYQNEATDGNTNSYRRLANYFYQRNGLSDANLSDYWKAQGMNPDGTRNAEFERLLDVDNLIDYMILTYYTSDADGPGSKFTRPRVNNYFGIFNRENPDGFKFFEHDSEHSLDTGNAAGANYNMVVPLTTGGAEFRYFNPHWMHERLAETNTEYRTRFADRVYELMFNDGPLTPERAKEVVDARASQFDLAIIAESARWGDAKRGNPFTKNDWVRAVDRIRSFIDGRVPVVVRQLEDQGWYPNTNPPQITVNGSIQLGGRADKDDEIALFATGSTSFTPIVPRGSTWNYLDDGSSQPPAWRGLGFDDSSWKSGRAELGYGDGNERTVVGFGPDSRNKFRTTYFRKTFQVSNPGQYQTLRLSLRRDDGAIVYLNGQEIVRSNMPSGNVDADDFAAGVVGGGEESTFFDFDLDVSALRDGTNVLAVEVHQANASSSDISFDLELQGGRFVVAGDNIYYTLDGSDPRQMGGAIAPSAIRFDGQPFQLDGSAVINARVREGASWSPLLSVGFQVDQPAVKGRLAITEINYHPHDPLTQFGDADASAELFEFIELANISDTTIDLTGVRFAQADTVDGRQGVVFPFAPQTLRAGERMVIVRDRQAFASRYGSQVRIADRADASPGAGVYTGGLSNGGELLTLLDAQGEVIEQFEYDDSGAWPGRSDGKGSTLERTNPSLDGGSPSSWRNSLSFGGTPGAEDTQVSPRVVINEVLTHTDLPQVDAIELLNVSDQSVSIAGWWVSDNDQNYFEYGIGFLEPALPPGGYRVFDETELGFGFRGEAADDVWLIAAEPNGRPVRFADHVEFGASVNGVSLGRWPNGSGRLFPMTELTFGTANSGPVLPGVAISEVLYHPQTQQEGDADLLEFVELASVSDVSQEISHWRLNKAIDYAFPADTVLASGQRVVVVPFDPTDETLRDKFVAYHQLTDPIRMFGPYTGVLDDGGENLELDRPEDVAQLGLGYVLVDRVDYDDDAPWPVSADGQGDALHRKVPVAYGDFVSSWISAAPSPGDGNPTNPVDVPGDFTGDRLVNVEDIQAMCGALHSPEPAMLFDLDKDGQVSDSDFAFLIEQILRTSVGDSNLDRSFDSTDLIVVFQAGEYEDTVAGNSTWAEGDWDCDGDFNSLDLIAAFQAGTYALPALPAAAAVSPSDLGAALQDGQWNTEVDRARINRQHLVVSVTRVEEGQRPSLELASRDSLFEADPDDWLASQQDDAPAATEDPSIDWL